MIGLIKTEKKAEDVMDFSFVNEPFSQYDKNSEEAIIVTSPFFTVSKM